jgi:hypothetical protein
MLAKVPCWAFWSRAVWTMAAVKRVSTSSAISTRSRADERVQLVWRLWASTARARSSSQASQDENSHGKRLDGDLYVATHICVEIY